jgi:hypothetical protein
MIIMSHTGNRANKNIAASMIDRIINDPKPKRIPVSPEESIIQKGGVLDGHEIIGEFAGNGTTVFVGLSTSQELDIENVLNDDEKGVIIGYTPSSVYFQLFRNDGAGSKVTTVLDNRFKDTENHKFELKLQSGKLLIKFDGAEDTITTKIPSSTDTLYIVNYGIY